MDSCPNCGMGAEGLEFCPECGVKVAPRRVETSGSEDRVLQARAVYLAGDELSAVTLQRVLEADGIEAWIQVQRGGGMEGLSGAPEEGWGRVVVFEDQEESARSVIEAYLKSLGPGVH